MLHAAANRLREHHGSAVPARFVVGMPATGGGTDAVLRQLADQQGRIIALLADRGQNGYGDKGGGGKGSKGTLYKPKGKGKGGGSADGKGGKGGKGGGTDGYISWKRNATTADLWTCSDCGESRNYSSRSYCYKCHAPKRSPVARQTQSLSAAVTRPLRPHARRDDGPIGADNKRPLFTQFIRNEARLQVADGKAPKCDDDDFTVVARAAGVWPRVGGGDGPASKPQAVPNGGEEPQSQPPAGPQPKPVIGGAGNDDKTSTGAGGGTNAHARQSWANAYDDEQRQKKDDDIDDVELWREGDMQDVVDDGCGDGDADDGEDETPQQETTAKDLHEQWQQRKDILEVVRAKFKKGQPQFETAKREATEAYERWQEAQRAESAPRLASLHQRRQKRVDQAEKALQHEMDAAEKQLEKHNEIMQAFKERIKEKQNKLDEAKERLQLVL